MEDKERKSSQYYMGPEEQKDSMTMLNERLSGDLRYCVRRLGFFPVMSPAWKEMVPSLSRMAVVTEVESSLPQAKDSSLWETEEQAVRFIMEDGKLNLLLRSVAEYKAHRFNVKNTPEEIDILENIALCDEFEVGIGRVLFNCWLHVETLQTTDIPALMSHTARVLQSVVSTPGEVEALGASGKLAQRQETMVCLYLGQIVRHLEAIREDRVMPYVRKAGVFMCVARYLHKAHAFLSAQTTTSVLQSLSILVETEDFTTYREAYCSGASGEVDELCAFKAAVIAPLLSSLPREQRVSVKPVADAIDKCKRLLGAHK